ncbi:hypothetical protein MKW98_006583 [Papaver atlanticum]|uniref:Peptidase M48 domain-containing protein n=1 Tax=Papaver atlanticum TaxID=357466 RepID=A0AAD4XSV7_9MAGN|nr:hypothetical protein MKW98_006583 [Papaver atlanticum]
MKGNLPETHPDSVRVRLIDKNIIEALQKDVVLDVAKGVQESSSGQANNGSKVATYHLDGLKWEVMVVNEPTVNAFCVPGGKIVVFTGLLDNFKSDAEVATILAHEVGHVVARHGAEKISNTMFFHFLKMILDILINDKSENQSKNTTDNQSENTTEKQREQNCYRKTRLWKGLRDDKGVQESSGEAKKGFKVSTYLLEGLDWETLILVYTGLLDYFRSDAEVASVLAHEVGHAVARHGPVYISNSLCFEFLKITLNTLFRNTGDTTSLDEACKYLLVYLSFSRRIKIEADYIGLLLLASAGYDPRVAIQVCEKFGELEDGGSFLGDYLATHPSGKKRAQLLSQDKVMEEALSIYREPNFNRGFERRVSYCCSFWESAFLLFFTVLLCVLLRKKTQIDP